MNISDLKPLFPAEALTDGRLLIAGPCSAESEEQTLRTATALSHEGVKIFRAGVWKPRTKPGGFEGVGTPALEWLSKVRRDTGMLVATEIASASHLHQVVDAGLDAVWIGARTSANPFAVQEIADAFAALTPQQRDSVAVLVKNPVNTDLELWIGALQRLYAAGVRRLGAIHRGFSAYGDHLYRNRPEWRIPIELRRRLPHIPLICDPSHIGGRRDLVAPLATQAMRLNFDGLMIECHCCPERALSDSEQQITPPRLGDLLRSLHQSSASLSPEILEDFRRQIDDLDDRLIDILAARMEVAREIGQLKKENGMQVLQPDRYNSLIRNRVEAASAIGLDADFIKRILAEIHQESVRQQLNL